jgi:uncharacterized damage-inducible protein DinB
MVTRSVPVADGHAERAGGGSRAWDNRRVTTAPSPITTGSGSERGVLESFLDFHRAVVLGKVADLPMSVARMRLVPSQTTLAGLPSHLVVVEREWFQRVLSGEPAPTAEGADQQDRSWVVSERDTLAELLVAYQQECDRSRAAAAHLHLDDTVPHPSLGRVSLRWIYVHTIEETARHAGHADILRELTDGSIGVI